MTIEKESIRGRPFFGVALESVVSLIPVVTPFYDFNGEHARRQRGQDDAAKMAKWHRRQAVERRLDAVYLANHDRVVELAAGNPLALAMLDLHGPDVERTRGGEPTGAVNCRGCPDDADYGPQDWPCQTYKVTARFVPAET